MPLSEFDRFADEERYEAELDPANESVVELFHRVALELRGGMGGGSWHCALEYWFRRLEIEDPERYRLEHLLGLMLDLSTAKDDEPKTAKDDDETAKEASKDDRDARPPHRHHRAR